MSKDLPLTEPEESDNIVPGYLGPTPPMGQPPQRGERLWVDRPVQLRHAADTLAQAKVIAVDAEFTQTRPYTQSGSSVPRLSLLQLAVDRHCFIVDTLRLGDLSPLKTVVESSDIVILLHGAGADLRVMAERGLNVVHYYDLEAASRSIFGQHESSLAAMLLRAFNLRLDKSLQRTDWTRRPLPPAMVAYAARDAEATLALYRWLGQYYSNVLQFHEHTGYYPAVSGWIDPFLRGNSHFSPEMAVADAQARGLIHNKDQVITDCRSALEALVHPMYRSRLLRLISDLSLAELAPDILPSLQALPSDERSASARALGRLGVKSARMAILPLLQDPVYDVRKAAQTALRNLDSNPPRQPRTSATKAADGSRRWTIETTDQAAPVEDGWKNRLRSIMDAG